MDDQELPVLLVWNATEETARLKLSTSSNNDFNLSANIEITITMLGPKPRNNHIYSERGGVCIPLLKNYTSSLQAF